MHENIIDKVVEVPVERVVQHTFENIVEKRVPVERLVYVDVPVDRVVEKTVDAPYENLIEIDVHRENIVNRTVE